MKGMVNPRTGRQEAITPPMLVGMLGSSMRPTLEAVDLLEVEAYGLRPIRVGDIVLVTSTPPEPELVVHRVVRFAGSRVITRGDSCQCVDDSSRTAEHVVGRVIAATRGGRRRLVAGGFRGRFWAALLRSRRACARVLLGGKQSGGGATRGHGVCDRA